MERMNSFGLNRLSYVEKAKPQKNAVRNQIQSGAGGQECIMQKHMKNLSGLRHLD